MSNKIRTIVKSFSYVIVSNVITLLSSAITVLIIPKFIGVEEFAYWQLYLFYTIYIGFLQFGWTDGLYLKLGGVRYENLNKEKLFSQYAVFVIIQFVISLCLLGFSVYFENLNTFIFKMTAVSLFISNIMNMLLCILQATNRLKEYSRIIIIGKLTTIVIMTVIVLSGYQGFKLLIMADLLGKIVTLGCVLIACKDIVFNKIQVFNISFKDTIATINAGMKLMFANISNLLIIGIVRFGIERSWGVETFGRVSLVLNISNFMMVFINALGLVIFPLLRQTEKTNLPTLYLKLRQITSFLFLGSMVLYFPIMIVLSKWLPYYTDSLIYLSLLFPICVFESRTALLVNTFLKSLRKESILLKINVISLICSFMITMISTQVLNSLNFAVLTIFILLSLRGILAEHYLNKELEIDTTKEMILDVLLTVIFIVCSWSLSIWMSMLAYLIMYLLFVILRIKKINNAFIFIIKLK